MTDDLLCERRVREGLPWVELIAQQLGRRLSGLMPPEDLRGVGRAALLEAARSFDPSRAEFRAYATQRIRWAILDACRRETHGRAKSRRLAAIAASERWREAVDAEPRERDEELATAEVHQARLRRLLAGHATALILGLVAASELEDVPDEASNAEEHLARLQLTAQLRRAVSRLPERERSLVDRHYLRGEPFDAIAADLGISKSWASRIHGRAIRSLAHAMGAR